MNIKEQVLEGLKKVVNGKEVSFTREANAYRQGGYVVSQEHLTKENNMIEVYF